MIVTMTYVLLICICFMIVSEIKNKQTTIKSGCVWVWCVHCACCAKVCSNVALPIPKKVNSPARARLCVCVCVCELHFTFVFIPVVSPLQPLPNYTNKYSDNMRACMCVCARMCIVILCLILAFVYTWCVYLWQPLPIKRN